MWKWWEVLDEVEDVLKFLEWGGAGGGGCEGRVDD
jgi:hypothetical protein